MPAFTITAVSDQVRDVTTQKGEFKSYKLHLRDDRGELLKSVEWFRKASSPAPRKGEQIEGTVEDGQYGPKFRATPKQGGGFGGGRGKDPKERAEIRRQHAQTTALRYMELLQARNELMNASWETVQQWTNQFFTDSGSAS